MPADTTVNSANAIEKGLQAPGKAAGAFQSDHAASASGLGLVRLLMVLMAAGAVGLVMLEREWAAASSNGALALMGLLWVAVLVAKGASRG